MKTPVCALAAFFIFCAAPESYAQNRLVEEYSAAHAEFERIVSAAPVRGKHARADFPGLAAAISALSDHKKFLSNQKYTFDEVSQICVMATSAWTRYYAHFFADADRKDPAITRKMNEILTVHQDDLGPIHAFTHRCTGKMISLFSDSVSRPGRGQKKKDAVAADADELRSAARSAVSVTIGFADDADFRETYRTGILEAVADEAPRFAAILRVRDRQQLQRQALAMREKDVSAAVKGYLSVIAAAMSNSDCSGLCRY